VSKTTLHSQIAVYPPSATRKNWEWMRANSHSRSTSHGFEKLWHAYRPDPQYYSIVVLCNKKPLITVNIRKRWAIMSTYITLGTSIHTKTWHRSQNCHDEKEHNLAWMFSTISLHLLHIHTISYCSRFDTGPSRLLWNAKGLGPWKLYWSWWESQTWSQRRDLARIRWRIVGNNHGQSSPLLANMDEQWWTNGFPACSF
jgi:hypothetical protein